MLGFGGQQEDMTLILRRQRQVEHDRLQSYTKKPSLKEQEKKGRPARSRLIGIELFCSQVLVSFALFSMYLI